MKTGFIVLSMGVDIYIIREYEVIDETYVYHDLIKFQVKDGVISSIQIDENPRHQGMHEDWWRGISELEDMEDILRKAFYYVFMGGRRISTGKIE